MRKDSRGLFCGPDHQLIQSIYAPSFAGASCQTRQAEKQWFDPVASFRTDDEDEIMSRLRRASRLGTMVLLGAAGFATAGFCLLTTDSSLAGSLANVEVLAQDPYGQPDQEIGPFPQIPGDDGMPLGNGRRTRPARKKGVASDKSKKGDSTVKGKAASKKAGAAESGSGKLQFSKDIAPILVANCTGCHSGEGNGLKRGKLDLSTFETLQKGTPDNKVVIPGKPDESTLVRRIKGEDEPRMPQGANTRLSEAAIAKIQRWVKEGGSLDAGNDPKKPIASYAATADQVRRAEVAKLPVAERDKKTEAVGLERYKQANASVKPEVNPSEHFMFFSNLPKDRTTNTLKVLETQYGYLKRILGQAAVDWPEKVSIYAFSTRKDFIEFIRTVESRGGRRGGIHQCEILGSTAVRSRGRPPGGQEG